MVKRAGRCIVCGSNATVKSHLFPRALMLDMREDAPHLVQGTREIDGYTLPQNGEWDDTILCKEHEDRIGLGDDYAVRLIRRGRRGAKLIENGRAYALPNPRPDLLLHFIYATVWRVVVSRAGQRSGLDLRRYEPIIRNALLGTGPFELQAVAGLSNMGLRGMGPIRFVLYPYRQRFGGTNSWHFVINGFDFHLLTDHRRVPLNWGPYIVNDNDPLIVTFIDPMDIREIPSLQPLLRRMLTRSPRDSLPDHPGR